MKLKKASEPEMTPVAPAPAGGAVIADRFKLDAVAPSGPAGVGKTAATIALVCSLAAVAMLGIAAWLLYQNWTLIEGV